MRKRPEASWLLFRGALVANFALGALATYEPFSMRRELMLLVAFGVAYAFQHWLFDTRYFGGADEVAPVPARDDELYFGGQIVARGGGVGAEEQVLEAVLSPARQVGIRLGFAAVIGVCVLGRVHWEAGLQLLDVLHVLAALALVPAMSLNHFLVPPALSALAVVFHLKSAGLGEPLVPALFLLSLALTFVFHRYLELELGLATPLGARTPRGELDERHLLRSGALSALHAFAVLTLIVATVNCVVPRNADEDPLGLLAKLADALNRVDRQLTEKLPAAARLDGGMAGSTTSAAPGPRGGRAGGNGAPGPAAPSGAAGGSGAPNGTGASGASSGAGTSGTSGASAGSLGKTAQPKLPAGASGIPNLSIPDSKANVDDGNLDEHPPQGGTYNEDGQSPLTGVARNAEALTRELPKMRVVPTSATADLSSGMPKMSRQEAVDKVSQLAKELPSQQQQAQAPPSAGQADPEEAKKKIAELSQALEHGQAPAGPATEPHQQPNPSLQRDPEPPPSPPEKPFFTEAMLRRLLLLLALAALLAFLARAQSRAAGDATLKKVRLSRERRKRILSELAELNQRRVSPREEVLARYRFYLHLMEVAQFPKEDYLPAEDFDRRVGTSYPPLKPHSRAITETFCDVLYGEEEIGREKVQTYRNSMDAVLRYFGC
ncbi:MAG: hypothetical protein HY075_09435 [Deltaproteobacteria bacterium]|nr:hypothetical protein [Deltaproteobacteria bacterium]